MSKKNHSERLVFQPLHLSKLELFQQAYFSILTYFHALWVQMKRRKSLVYAAEIKLFYRLAWITCHGRVRTL